MCSGVWASGSTFSTDCRHHYIWKPCSVLFPALTSLNMHCIENYPLICAPLLSALFHPCNTLCLACQCFGQSFFIPFDFLAWNSAIPVQPAIPSGVMGGYIITLYTGTSLCSLLLSTLTESSVDGMALNEPAVFGNNFLKDRFAKWADSGIGAGGL